MDDLLQEAWILQQQSGGGGGAGGGAANRQASFSSPPPSQTPAPQQTFPSANQQPLQTFQNQQTFQQTFPNQLSFQSQDAPNHAPQATFQQIQQPPFRPQQRHEPSPMQQQQNPPQQNSSPFQPQQHQHQPQQFQQQQKPPSQESRQQQQRQQQPGFQEPMFDAVFDFPNPQPPLAAGPNKPAAQPAPQKPPSVGSSFDIFGALKPASSSASMPALGSQPSPVEEMLRKERERLAQLEQMRIKQLEESKAAFERQKRELMELQQQTSSTSQDRQNELSDRHRREAEQLQQRKAELDRQAAIQQQSLAEKRAALDRQALHERESLAREKRLLENQRRQENMGHEALKGELESANRKVADLEAALQRANDAKARLERAAQVTLQSNDDGAQAAKGVATEAGELLESFVSCSTALMTQCISAKSEANKWREATKSALNIIRRTGTDAQKHEFGMLVKEAAARDWMESARDEWKTQPLSADFTRLLMQKQMAMSRWGMPTSSPSVSAARPSGQSPAAGRLPASPPVAGSEHVQSLRFFSHLNEDIAQNERRKASSSSGQVRTASSHSQLVQEAGFVPRRPSEPLYGEAEESQMTLQFQPSTSQQNSERTKIQAALDVATANSKAALMKSREAGRGMLEKGKEGSQSVLNSTKTTLQKGKETFLNSNIGKKTVGRLGSGNAGAGEDDFFVSEPEGFRHEKHFGAGDADPDQMEFAARDESSHLPVRNVSFTTETYVEGAFPEYYDN